MKNMIIATMALVALGTSAASRVTSPNGRITVDIDVDDQGAPIYAVRYDGRTIVDNSRLGLTANEAAMTDGFTVTTTPVI
ncbi:MAG: glycoside hydrolase family 97 N-terminal domain-containing protein, partial [Muribaculaceae bacterium]|nr:glycoside hydrolase family 97 N-terminal domain-containing protein [Muribaculaceae bacterium]